MHTHDPDAPPEPDIPETAPEPPEDEAPPSALDEFIDEVRRLVGWERDEDEDADAQPDEPTGSSGGGGGGGPGIGGPGASVSVGPDRLRDESSSSSTFPPPLPPVTPEADPDLDPGNSETPLEPPEHTQESPEHTDPAQPSPEPEDAPERPPEAEDTPEFWGARLDDEDEPPPEDLWAHLDDDPREYPPEYFGGPSEADDRDPYEHFGGRDEDGDPYAHFGGQGEESRDPYDHLGSWATDREGDPYAHFGGTDEGTADPYAHFAGPQSAETDLPAEPRSVDRASPSESQTAPDETPHPYLDRPSADTLRDQAQAQIARVESAVDETRLTQADHPGWLNVQIRRATESHAESAMRQAGAALDYLDQAERSRPSTPPREPPDETATPAQRAEIAVERAEAAREAASRRFRHVPSDDNARTLTIAEQAARETRSHARKVAQGDTSAQAETRALTAERCAFVAEGVMRSAVIADLVAARTLIDSARQSAERTERGRLIGRDGPNRAVTAAMRAIEGGSRWRRSSLPAGGAHRNNAAGALQSAQQAQSTVERIRDLRRAAEGQSARFEKKVAEIEGKTGRPWKKADEFRAHHRQHISALRDLEASAQRAAQTAREWAERAAVGRPFGSQRDALKAERAALVAEKLADHATRERQRFLDPERQSSTPLSAPREKAPKAHEPTPESRAQALTAHAERLARWTDQAVAQAHDTYRSSPTEYNRQQTQIIEQRAESARAAIGQARSCILESAQSGSHKSQRLNTAAKRLASSERHVREILRSNLDPRPPGSGVPASTPQPNRPPSQASASPVIAEARRTLEHRATPEQREALTPRLDRADLAARIARENADLAREIYQSRPTPQNAERTEQTQRAANLAQQRADQVADKLRNAVETEFAVRNGLDFGKVAEARHLRDSSPENQRDLKMVQVAPGSWQAREQLLKASERDIREAGQRLQSAERAAYQSGQTLPDPRGGAKRQNAPKGRGMLRSTTGMGYAAKTVGTIGAIGIGGSALIAAGTATAIAPATVALGAASAAILVPTTRAIWRTLAGRGRGTLGTLRDRAWRDTRRLGAIPLNAAGRIRARAQESTQIRNANERGALQAARATENTLRRAERRLTRQTERLEKAYADRPVTGREGNFRADRDYQQALRERDTLRLSAERARLHADTAGLDHGRANLKESLRGARESLRAEQLANRVESRLNAALERAQARASSQEPQIERRAAQQDRAHERANTGALKRWSARLGVAAGVGAAVSATITSGAWIPAVAAGAVATVLTGPLNVARFTAAVYRAAKTALNPSGSSARERAQAREANALKALGAAAKAENLAGKAERAARALETQARENPTPINRKAAQEARKAANMVRKAADTSAKYARKAEQRGLGTAARDALATDRQALTAERAANFAERLKNRPALAQTQNADARRFRAGNAMLAVKAAAIGGAVFGAGVAASVQAPVLGGAVAVVAAYKTLRHPIRSIQNMTRFRQEWRQNAEARATNERAALRAARSAENTAASLERRADQFAQRAQVDRSLQPTAKRLGELAEKARHHADMSARNATRAGRKFFGNNMRESVAAERRALWTERAASHAARVANGQASPKEKPPRPTMKPRMVAAAAVAATIKPPLFVLRTARAAVRVLSRRGRAKNRLAAAQRVHNRKLRDANRSGAYRNAIAAEKIARRAETQAAELKVVADRHSDNRDLKRFAAQAQEAAKSARVAANEAAGWAVRAEGPHWRAAMRDAQRSQAAHQRTAAAAEQQAKAVSAFTTAFEAKSQGTDIKADLRAAEKERDTAAQNRVAGAERAAKNWGETQQAQNQRLEQEARRQGRAQAETARGAEGGGSSDQYRNYPPSETLMTEPEDKTQDQTDNTPETSQPNQDAVDKDRHEMGEQRQDDKAEPPETERAPEPDRASAEEAQDRAEDRERDERRDEPPEIPEREDEKAPEPDGKESPEAEREPEGQIQDSQEVTAPEPVEPDPERAAGQDAEPAQEHSVEPDNAPEPEAPALESSEPDQAEDKTQESEPEREADSGARDSEPEAQDQSQEQEPSEPTQESQESSLEGQDQLEPHEAAQDGPEQTQEIDPERERLDLDPPPQEGLDQEHPEAAQETKDEPGSEPEAAERDPEPAQEQEASAPESEPLAQENEREQNAPEQERDAPAESQDKDYDIPTDTDDHGVSQDGQEMSAFAQDLAGQIGMEQNAMGDMLTGGAFDNMPDAVERTIEADAREQAASGQWGAESVGMADMLTGDGAFAHMPNIDERTISEDIERHDNWQSARDVIDEVLGSDKGQESQGMSAREALQEGLGATRDGGQEHGHDRGR